MKLYTTWKTVVACQIRRVRVASGLTQAEFAKRMGMTQSSWSRIEQGRVALPAHRLAEVAMLVPIDAVEARFVIPDLRSLRILMGNHVDVLSKPDPKRRQLGHRAVYDLLYT